MRALTSHRWLGLFVMTLLVAPSLAMAQGPRLQLDKLTRLASQASKVTDISLDPAMLALAGNFLAADDPENAAIKQLIGQLQGVHVKSFEFDRDDAYSTADVELVRKQLTGGWTRLALVTEQSKTGRELVEVYAHREGDRSTGLAILVAEPRELTVVNIVGPLDLSKLAALQGKLGIPNIPIQ